MNPRVLLAVTFLVLASRMASAGVIVFEEDAPAAVQPGFSMTQNGSADPLAIEQVEGEATSMAIFSPVSVVLMAAVASDRVLVPPSDSSSERLQVDNADLPASPFFDHLLKPS